MNQRSIRLLAREQLLYLLENLNKTYAHLTMIYVTHVIEEIIPLFSKIFLLKRVVVLIKE